MQSDILPFTAYDSMGYETVGQMAPPPGFGRRDAPSVQSRTEQPVQQIHPGQVGGATGGGGGIAVKQAPQEDIDLPKFEDYGEAKGDISNYKNMKDLLYIFIAVLVVEVVVIFLTRFFPEVFGGALNRWYDAFGLSAVIADVFIIVIGFLIARYVYTGYMKEKFAEGKWNPLIFTGTLVMTQLIHDLGFYFGVINQVPRGHNAMMDVFKDYAASGGAKILFGDAAMMIASAGIAIVLKSQPTHIVASIGTLFGYALPYILYTRNQFSSLRT
jgi:hypothetical protein